MQPSDKDEQGNVLTTDELSLNKMDTSNCTPDKQDAKPVAAQEEQETPPSSKWNRRCLRKKNDETEKIETLRKFHSKHTKTTT
jgi:hypothetical protein